MLDLAANANALLASIVATHAAHAPRPVPTKECPECEGHGEAEYVIGEDRSGMGGISPICRYVRCERCDGTGEVEHDDLCDCPECWTEDE